MAVCACLIFGAWSTALSFTNQQRRVINVGAPSDDWASLLTTPVMSPGNVSPSAASQSPAWPPPLQRIAGRSSQHVVLSTTDESSITARRSSPRNLLTGLKRCPCIRRPATRTSPPRTQGARGSPELRRMVTEPTRGPRHRRRRLLRPPLGPNQPAQRSTHRHATSQPQYPGNNYRTRARRILAMRLRGLEYQLVSSRRNYRLRTPPRLARRVRRPWDLGCWSLTRLIWLNRFPFPFIACFSFSYCFGQLCQ